MADYFTQVSFVVQFDNRDDVLAALNRLEIMENECEEGDFYTGCDITAEKNNTIWIRSDKNANLEAIVDWLQITMQRMHWTEPLYFTWSNSCSKLRTDAFDGGAVVITQDEQYWMNSDHWAREKAKEIQTWQYRWKQKIKSIFGRRSHVRP